MFDGRNFIGLNFCDAQKLLLEQGYQVVKIENNDDDKHEFDVELVVKASIEDNVVTIVTSRFLMNI